MEGLMSEAETPTPAATRSSPRGIARRLFQLGLMILLQAVLLFGSAGSLRWRPGWAYLGLYLLMLVLNAIVLLPNDQGLIEERGRAKEGVPAWDRTFARIYALLGPSILIVGGLNARFGWPPALPLWLQVLGGAIMALAYLLFARAMWANRFFSTAVRVQKDRGHTVVSSGPYRFVRHPAYAGSLALCLVTPLLLGSAWALIPGVLTDAAILVRTALEDATLQRELEGYSEYARRVRFRLIPGIW
jgi:protein-S-isoprenylcysteine O-methyltransferase Ste14